MTWRNRSELRPWQRVMGLLTAAVVAACSSNEATPGESGGTGGSTGTGGAGAAVGVYGTVTAYDYEVPDSGGLGMWQATGPVSGMQVCLDGLSDSCATTATDGTYRLDGVPGSSPIALTFEHADFAGRTLVQGVTETADYLYSPPLVTTVGLNHYLTGSGCSVPVAAGSTALYIGAPPGAKAVITPAPSTPIVYFGATGFDPSATAIDAQVDPSLAAAVACGLAPGEYDVDFQGTPSTCHMAEGWPVAGHDVRAVVQSGAITVINWICN